MLYPDLNLLRMVSTSSLIQVGTRYAGTLPLTNIWGIPGVAPGRGDPAGDLLVTLHDPS